MSHGEVLANRLRKRQKHLAKWARRRGVTCYRVYDRDIPEIPLTVDWYDGEALVSHFARHGHDDTWIDESLAAIQGVLELPHHKVFFRTRERQSGSAQYQRLGKGVTRREVEEGGHKFYVDLRDFLDTGLFLDHRETRRMVGEWSGGKRFLNLFCYTASFTVYAAGGGAVSSTSVDMSNRYTDWARENFALNGLGRAHQVIRDDVFAFLRKDKGIYDVAVVDPPTFSNSKKMNKEMDLLRDHETLLASVKARMAPGGVVMFSTNRKSFKLGPSVERDFAIEDISKRTHPEDFHRQPHHAWRLTLAA